MDKEDVKLLMERFSYSVEAFEHFEKDEVRLDLFEELKRLFKAVRRNTLNGVSLQNVVNKKSQ